MPEVSWCEFPHCGHSAAPPHGKTPVTGVEIPGLKGLGQHFTLGQVCNAGLGQCTGGSAGTEQELSSAAGMGGTGLSRAAEGS